MSDSTRSVQEDSFHVLTGILFVLIAAFGFLAKAVLIKLAYASGAVDAISLLALRMAMSLPFFLIAVAWIGRRIQQPSMRRLDWLIIAVLGMLGYYFASFLDFKVLTYISAGPVRTLVLAYFLLDEQMSLVQIAGTVSVLFGVYLITR